MIIHNIYQALDTVVSKRTIFCLQITNHANQDL